jgi:hypothetical protein
MIVNRRTFVIKRGRMEDAKSLLKETGQWWPPGAGMVRFYVTNVGAWNQLAFEVEFQSLADYERIWAEAGATVPAEWWHRWFEVLDAGGGNEIWTLLE